MGIFGISFEEKLEMGLREKAEQVKIVFDELREESVEFEIQGGLSCISGCGQCCTKPTIPASALEFLPFAYDLYDRGLAESTMEMLNQPDNSDICINYRPHSPDGKKGACGSYSTRGLICRLFAASARKNRLNKKEILICSPLKEQRSEKVKLASEKINSGELNIPLATDFYGRITSIDESLSEEFSINKAIYRALEAVLREEFYLSQEEG